MACRTGPGTAERDEPLPTAEQDLRSAFDNAPTGIAVLTPKGVLTGCNPALGRLLGRPPGALAGSTLFEVTHPDDLEATRRGCEALQSGRVDRLRLECRFLRPDGTLLWVAVSTSRVQPSPGRTAHLIMHVEDVTERRALEAELRHRALHDGLTGLPNRALLMDRIGHALAAGTRSARPTSLFFLDLNGFKSVNDQHGHEAGDCVLQELAARLSRLLRPGDTAARLGGDEFAVLCEDTGVELAAPIAARLAAVTDEPFTVDGGHRLRLTTAVGVTCSDEAGGPEDGPLDASALLRRADQQMYVTKRRRSDDGADLP